MPIPRRVLREDRAVAKKQGITIRVRLTAPEIDHSWASRLSWRTNGEKAGLQAGEAVHSRAVAGDPAQLCPVEHAKPANVVYGGAGTVPVGSRWPATKSRTHPNTRTSLVAVAEGEVTNRTSQSLRQRITRPISSHSKLALRRVRAYDIREPPNHRRAKQ